MTATDAGWTTPANQGPDDFPWGEIMASIDDRRLTPFLGAGISHPPLPSGSELAARLADARLAGPTRYPFISRDLMDVAQFWATLLSPSAPKRFVKEWFQEIAPPDFEDETQPHAILAALPILVYLTTNYDTYMEQALGVVNRTARTEICRWNSGLKIRYRQDTMAELEPEFGKPVVYHLHGSLDDYDSYVLTEDDYLDFMVNARRFDGGSDLSQRVIPASVDELLALNSLLFVGYGLKDWNLKVLLRTLVQTADKTAQKLSVSVQLEPDDRIVEGVGRAQAVEYLNKYFDGLKIRVYWGSLDEFLIELGLRWKAWKKEKKERAAARQGA